MNRKWLVLGGVSTVAAALDQWSKLAVHEKIPLSRHVQVVNGLFDLVHVRNRGGAFGLFASMNPSVRGPVFLVLSLAAIVLVVGMIRGTPPGRSSLVVALSLVLGGAIGNLIDRIRLGEVIDFLDFYHGRYHWPAFNVADVAIVVGVGILMIDLIRHPDDRTWPPQNGDATASHGAPSAEQAPTPHPSDA